MGANQKRRRTLRRCVAVLTVVARRRPFVALVRGVEATEVQSETQNRRRHDRPADIHRAVAIEVDLQLCAIAISFVVLNHSRPNGAPPKQDG